jgi:hypothetical protein
MFILNSVDASGLSCACIRGWIVRDAIVRPVIKNGMNRNV